MPRPRTPQEIQEFDRRVWDLVLHLVHPAALYVCLQIAVSCHLWQSPLLSDARGYGWLYYGMFLAQYLGAWATLYSTLMRDSGLRSRTALGLVAAAAAGLAAQLLWLDSPRTLSAGWLHAVLAWHVVPAVGGWAWTLVRWRRAKARLAPLLPS